MILLVVANFVTSCKIDEKHENTTQILNQKNSKTGEATPKKQRNSADFENINFEKNGFVEKMAYATTKNFTKQKIYPCAECYLRKEVADALEKANEKAKMMDLKIVIFDCYRPLSLQKKMFDIVKNSDYVADPQKASKHNRGCALDVSLADKNGTLLNMGTDFDDFSENSHYANTNLDSEERKNRKILRNLMAEFGFIPYDKEWWHFNYKNADFPASNFQWKCN